MSARHEGKDCPVGELSTEWGDDSMLWGKSIPESCLKCIRRALHQNYAISSSGELTLDGSQYPYGEDMDIHLGLQVHDNSIREAIEESVFRAAFSHPDETVKTIFTCFRER